MKKYMCILVMKNNYLIIIKNVMLRNFDIFFYMEDIGWHEDLVRPKLCVD